MIEKSLVLLSGGQDSATCLALASKQSKKIYTISFDYGQRHSRELECSEKLSDLAEVEDHFLIDFKTLGQLGGSALVNKEDNISSKHEVNKDLPASFVPGRNMLFLTLAAAKAYQLGVKDLYTGTCQTDFSGYPDCRDNSIKAVQVALFLCLDFQIIIHTPLMWMTKAETVLLMKDLERLDWYKYTHTCYEGMNPPCGECPSCILRAKGFKEAGIDDPLLYYKYSMEDLNHPLI